jgi:hypothetical protein
MFESLVLYLIDYIFMLILIQTLKLSHISSKIVYMPTHCLHIENIFQINFKINKTIIF